jgi:hypothetical protein
LTLPLQKTALSPHPEERALARVSKDEAPRGRNPGLMVRDAA